MKETIEKIRIQYEKLFFGNKLLIKDRGYKR